MVSSKNLFRTFYEKIKDKFLSLLPDISKIKLIKISIFGIFVSFIFWSIEASILWIIVFSISPIKISLSKAIYIYLISGVAGMLSGLPGGIGINETASTLMLVNEGLTGISALTVSILRRIFTIWSITVLSLASSLPVKKMRKSIYNI